MQELYKELGICEEVYKLSKDVLDSLELRFKEIDKITEYNQLKVLKAMQENKVSEACLYSSTGYGYNDIGRDTLEKVYASYFHTEDALVRPQIACGTHALAIALSATSTLDGLVVNSAPMIEFSVSNSSVIPNCCAISLALSRKALIPDSPLTTNIFSKCSSIFVLGRHLDTLLRDLPF